MGLRDNSIILVKKGKDAIWIAFFLIVFVALIIFSSWKVSFLIALLFLAGILINIRVALLPYFLILLIPLTRFPGISQYLESLKYLIFSLALFFWFSKSNFKSLCNFRDNPLNIFFLTFSALILLSLVFSSDRILSLRWVFAHLISFGCFYLFFDFFRNKEYLKRSIFLFIVTGLFVSILSILQYIIAQHKIFIGLERYLIPTNQQYYSLFDSKRLLEIMGFRSVGTFYHPNLLGIYLSMVLPFNLCYIFSSRGKVRRILFAVSSLIIFAAIYCSGSRGSLLSILISMSFLVFAFWKSIPKFLFFLCLLIAVVLVFIFLNKVAYYLRLEDILSYRDIIWDNSIEMIKARPLIGWGLGTFHKIYTTVYGFPSLVDFQTSLRDITIMGSSELLQSFHAHNLFLNYAAEAGIFAPPILLFFYFLYLKETLPAVKLIKPLGIFDYSLIMGSISVMLGDLVHSFFEATTNFYNFSIAISFVFIAAAGLSSFFHYKSKTYALDNNWNNR